MQLWLVISFGLVITGFLFFLFFQQPRFGKLPRGKDLRRIEQSENYRKGRFWNQVTTPALAEHTNYWKLLWRLLFQSSPRKRPASALPTVKINLKELAPHQNTLIWFGHSSYFIQMEGLKILVDPVFSGSASPCLLELAAFGELTTIRQLIYPKSITYSLHMTTGITWIIKAV